ncbi:response regulator transcription factor [Clostridium sp. MSJ-8]|uniref:response regulator transcription factor n=1 Tax=Clostridium sp. MSJ-8 TaxID=2841510 RepID=UPI001C0EFB3B|nr:response regulator transcription factor [Clostridium sp. MSJ-8]MBU5487728.1 response regulator transcription factor [Clostridium sp. MSJ-8]
MKKILIVDDEEHILELLDYNLKKEGYLTYTCNNGIKAMEVIGEVKPDLVLLDVMLPGMNGLEICKNIKRTPELDHISIIMITAKDEEIDKILGLELGADDYITKPFSVRELEARIKAVLRRFSERKEEKKITSKIMDFGRLKVNGIRREVIVDDKVVPMTLKEYELLEILVNNEGKILEREVLLDKVWGYGYEGETRTVDVHIRYLRKKIELDDKNPKYIETVRGIGYRFNSYMQ